MDLISIIALTIFFLAFIMISTEIISKTITALLGAGIYIIFGFIGQNDAVRHIDWNVIFLLIGMMIIVGITKRTGLFQYLAIKTAKLAKGNPAAILIMLSILTGLLSALLDNVTTVLILTPISILIAVELGLSPTPFVICDALSANIGGTATLVGDPPNIMIGSAAELSFAAFIANLGPPVLLIYIVFCLLIYALFRSKLKASKAQKARIMQFDETRSLSDHKLLVKCLLVLFLVLSGFLMHDMLGIAPGSIALVGAAVLMLLTEPQEIEELFHEVEWTSIFFFLGLFMMVGTLEEIGIIDALAQLIIQATEGNVLKTGIAVLWLSGTLSGIVDNIPYVATMIPLVQNIEQVTGRAAAEPIWWSLAIGSCLGGNGTLIGASANVVSVNISNKSGYKISFLEFTKYGILITAVTLIIANLYLYLVQFAHLH